MFFSSENINLKAVLKLIKVSEITDEKIQN